MRTKARQRVKTPLLDKQIHEYGGSLHILIERSKELRRTARDELRPQLAALEEKRKAAVKAARQSSGLYWGNYGAVVAPMTTLEARRSAIALSSKSDAIVPTG
jgi:hypothetical protein